MYCKIYFKYALHTIPPLGFNTSPTIEFTNEDQLPISSTCSLSLNPINSELNFWFAIIMYIAYEWVGYTLHDDYKQDKCPTTTC